MEVRYLATRLDARRRILVEEVQRHVHLDAVTRGNAHQIYVGDERLRRMTLEVFQDHLLRLAIHLHLEDVRIKRLVLKMVEQFIVLGGKHLRLLATTVDDPGYQSLATQAAARTFALIATGHCNDFVFFCMSRFSL